MTVVIDTNVILVANGQHGEVSPECIAACALRLQTIVHSGRLAIDDAYRILNEYQNKTRANRGKGPGDAFVKWALQNNVNAQRCDRVAIEHHDERGFESFPNDERLVNFDPPDRKFVAVASAHPQHPPILEAVDSKWLDWAPALNDYGVRVDFLCEADIKRFHQNKFGT